MAPGYAPGEHHFPYDYAKTPGSLARAWFTDDEMARSLDFLAGEQQEDGGWPIRWRQWAPGTAWRHAHRDDRGTAHPEGVRPPVG